MCLCRSLPTKYVTKFLSAVHHFLCHNIFTFRKPAFHSISIASRHQTIFEKENYSKFSQELLMLEITTTQLWSGMNSLYIFRHRSFFCYCNSYSFLSALSISEQFQLCFVRRYTKKQYTSTHMISLHQVLHLWLCDSGGEYF